MKNDFYPRARLRRESFFSLDGEWDFAYSKEKSAPSRYEEKITVPFPPESRLSGICRGHEKNEYMFYRKVFSLPEGFVSGEGEVLLHFGAVDQYASVYINGEYIGSHTGGYLPFSFSVGEFLREENELSVRVLDPLDHTLPYGKQKEKRGGMWYTPHSGIWQSIWMEFVPRGAVLDIAVSSNDTEATITVKTESESALLSYLDGDERVEIAFSGSVTVKPKSARLWSPEEPSLYPFSVSTEAETVTSYFALRRLEVKKVNGSARFYLNGKPYFLNGVLDQGYFEGGIVVPENPSEYEKDILRMKELGFNMLRKHIKLEPPAFYEACDRLGMIVFQDAVNNGTYNFLTQTALPTVAFKRVPRFFLGKSKRAREIFREHTLKMLREVCFYPSVLLFTLFNEGWGQSRDADTLYKEFKALYPNMLFDTASGWFKTKATDMRSDHVYFKRVRACYKGEKLPVMLSEFGGYSYPVTDHLFNTERNYGYGTCKNSAELLARLEKLYLGEILPAIASGVSGLVYTQLSDVEDETNGFYTYDREVCKVDKQKMKNMMQACENAYLAACTSAEEK